MKRLLACISLMLNMSAFAQSDAPTRPSGLQVSSGSIQIQGNTSISSANKNTAAIAVGEGNVAKNSSGVIRGSTQPKGTVGPKGSSTPGTASKSAPQ